MAGKYRFIIAVLAAVLTVAAILLGNRPQALPRSTMADVRAEAKAGDYRLITTGELAKLHGKNPDLLVVDTRQDWEFRAGHIKGAINFPMEPTWWSRWQSKDDLARILGPDKERPLVFY